MKVLEAVVMDEPSRNDSILREKLVKKGYLKYAKIKGGWVCERKVERATKNAEEGKEEVGKSRKNVLEARSIKNFKQESPA